MVELADVRIRSIFDSRGNPTVEVDVITKDGKMGRAAAPSGASKGSLEVADYPSGGLDVGMLRFRSSLVPKLKRAFSSQEELDSLLHEIDGTNNLSKIGGNIAIALSLAFAKAFAASEGMPLYRHIGGVGKLKLPRPVGNVIGGGKHAINGTVMQEFLAVAEGRTYYDSIKAAIAVHKKIGQMLRQKFPNLALGLGDEKAWVAPLSDMDALGIVRDASVSTSSEIGVPLNPAIDLAATSFFENGKYAYKDRALAPAEQIEFVAKLVNQFGIKIVEDPLHESDFDGFTSLTKLIGSKSIVVGDDLFVTNTKMLQKGIEKGAANGVLIKPNQIGTLTEMINTVKLAHANGYTTMISHRSGETEDTTIAHLAVGLGIKYIKTGTVGGERLAKHNELIRIEEEILAQ
jgi:enolase